MPLTPNTPVGGWFDADDQLLDSSVFDFGPRTDIAKSLADTATAIDLGQNLVVAHVVNIGASSDTRPTRNAAAHAMHVMEKAGDQGALFACWQNGAGGTPAGLVYSVSNDGGLSWSAPIQISSRTNVYGVPVKRKDTNDIWMFYAGISRATSTLTYMRALAYTGSPGAASWAIGVELTTDATGNRGSYSGDTDETGFTYWFGMRSDANPDRVNVRRMTLPNDPSTTAGSDKNNLVNGLDIWTSAVRVSSYAGSWLIATEQGGQYRLFWAAQEGGTDVTLAQIDTFFMTDSEEFDLGYQAGSVNQACFAYINGTAITYRLYNYTSDGVIALASGPNTITTPGACHSPLVQADANGGFYILWIEESAVTTQRKVRAINTAAPGTIYDIFTDATTGSLHDLNGPRTVGIDQQVKFMASDTASNVYLVTVPLPVFKTVADTVTGQESTLGVEVLFGDTATAVDSPAQTTRIDSGSCRGGDVFDAFGFDVSGFDAPCTPYDTNDKAFATEVLNFGPQVLETGTGVDAFSLTVAFDEPASGAEGLDVSQTVPDTATADDTSQTVDQQPQGDQNDSGTADDSGLLLEVLADDAGTAAEAFDVNPDAGALSAETGTGVETLDLQTTDLSNNAPADTATGAEGTFDIGNQVDDLATAVDDASIEVPVDETVIADDSGITIEILVADVVVATDSDPSSDVPVSHDAADSGTVTEAFTVVTSNGLSVRLHLVSGHAKLRVEGNRQPQLNVRN